MPTRRIACLAVTASALLGPVAGASAIPADHVDREARSVSAAAPADPVRVFDSSDGYSPAPGFSAPVQADPVRVADSSDGFGTTAVLALIGCTLLGGASGFGSGRIVTRRRALSH
jgi:hypothetical protein